MVEPARLVVPATPASVGTVHAALGRVMDDAQVGDLDRMAFETAIMEIVSNVIQHAASADRPGSFDAVIRADDDCLRAEVRHPTSLPEGLDLSAVDMPDDPEAEHGRGLPLVQALTDELRHERDGDSDVWVLIRVRRDTGDANR